MYPRKCNRDPEEYYDVVYDTVPERQDIYKIINHPRKLITVNLCANPYDSRIEEVFEERSCFKDYTSECCDF